MSTPDDPFANNGRTVIRPRPGGATSGNAPSPGNSPFGVGGGQPGQNPFGGQGNQNPFGGQNSQNPFGGTGSASDWDFTTPTQQQPAPPPSGRRIPLQMALNSRIGHDIKASNPITQAATPLLILLGRLRLQVVDMDAMPLMQHVSASIMQFEKTLLAQNIDPEQVRTAKYALCATADDIVQNLPGDKHVWLQYSMLPRFFNERTSGTGFFEYIRKLASSPAVYYDLLELIHACLSLGFEGQYRSMAGGDIELQRIRRDVFLTLRNVRQQGMVELSPRWRGMDIKLGKFRDGIPVWVYASFLATLLAVLYIVLRVMSSDAGEAAASTLLTLHPSDEIKVARVAPPPDEPKIVEVEKIVTAKQLTQLERIRGVLQNEIKKNLIDVRSIGDRIVIRVSNLLLFDSGKADVKPEFAALAARIANSLNKEPGNIFIVGHTDKTKLRATSPFKSNFDLSVKRAQAVATMIEAKLKDPKRVAVSGKGDTQPIADEKTDAGKRQNRRVEISIPTEESL